MVANRDWRVLMHAYLIPTHDCSTVMGVVYAVAANAQLLTLARQSVTCFARYLKKKTAQPQKRSQSYSISGGQFVGINRDSGIVAVVDFDWSKGNEFWKGR
jgi:hypothetical protein